jgi:U3 small nucleolar RNA-associated protein 20
LLWRRFSGLWAPAGEALAAALDAYPALAWPLLFAQLTAAQADFLAGDCEARPRAAGPAAGPPPRALLPRFAAAVAAGGAAAAGGSTDAAARVTHLLKAVAGANNHGVENRAKQWGPLFLALSAAKDVGEEADDGGAAGVDLDPAAAGVEAAEDGASAEIDGEEEDEEEEEGGAVTIAGGVSRVSMRAWRAALREWLALLGGLKGVRSVAGGAALQAAVTAHVMDVDPSVQTAALRCLRAFKVAWLAPYADRLLRLADNKTLRSELAAFPLALAPTSMRAGEELAGGVLPEHRAPLVALLVRLLYPKMRKRSGRLGGKGARGGGRARAQAPLVLHMHCPLRSADFFFLFPMLGA